MPHDYISHCNYNYVSFEMQQSPHIKANIEVVTVGIIIDK